MREERCGKKMRNAKATLIADAVKSQAVPKAGDGHPKTGGGKVAA
jgi:hypothetical protein